MKLTWFVCLLALGLAAVLIVDVFSEQSQDKAVVRDPLIKPTQQTGGKLSAEPTAEPAALTQLVQQATAPELAYEAFIATLPASLADVPRPAALTVDADGELVVDIQLRNLYEYYLSALGEESLEQVVARIKYDLNNQLQSPALDKALQLLESFVQFRNQQGIIKNDFAQSNGDQGFNLNMVREMKLAERQARASFFEAAEIAALFGTDDVYEDYMLARLSIMSDPDLSAQEKGQQLAQVEAQIAPAVLSNAATQQLARTLVQDQELNEQYTDTTVIQTERVARFGEQAAARLEQRDQQRDAWQRRVDAYRIDLQSIINSGADQVLIRDLRSAHFSGPELIRIAALDKLELNIEG